MLDNGRGEFSGLDESRCDSSIIFYLPRFDSTGPYYLVKHLGFTRMGKRVKAISHHPVSETEGQFPIEDTLAESMAQLSRDLLVRAIIISLKDRSPAAMSLSRPEATVLGLLTGCKSNRIANLLLSAIPLTVKPEEKGDSVSLAKRFVLKLCIASEGHNILLVPGVSSDSVLNTPSLTVVKV